ncbi:hypothetical protein BJ508DRAFT_329870 [Ascobolus immersus RN42]|uniref:F-box domain-containing protein n=1 Tax=Ascobolus immersus RN42 TaxID=1160509 RepID=A0A3N4HVH0_ASCIM|nr:hypothetical protein BJ508DRAFT_329870 [Ascobolus immersus RN42]
MSEPRSNAPHAQIPNKVPSSSIMHLPAELRLKIYTPLPLISLLQLSHTSSIFYKDINHLWHTYPSFRTSFHPKLAASNFRLTLSSLQHVDLTSTRERDLFIGTSLYAPKRPELQPDKGFWPCKICFKFYSNRAFLRWEKGSTGGLKHCPDCETMARRRLVLGENCWGCRDMDPLVETKVPQLRRQLTESVWYTWPPDISRSFLPFDIRY